MGGNLVANAAARATPGKGDLCTATSVAGKTGRRPVLPQMTWL